MGAVLSWKYEAMTICSRPMNTLSTKYSKSWSRVSGVSIVAWAKRS